MKRNFKEVPCFPSKKRFNKKGQDTMGMPFGIIFSVFLIVVFIVVAFIAVKYFLDIGDCSKIGMFYRDFQSAVDEAIKTQSSDDVFDVKLPAGIKKVCFGNLSAKITASDDYDELRDYEIYNANTFILPTGVCDLSYKLINHLNITKITAVKNPYCIPVSQGIKIKKDFYDRSVVVE